MADAKARYTSKAEQDCYAFGARVALEEYGLELWRGKSERPQPCKPLIVWGKRILSNGQRMRPEYDSLYIDVHGKTLCTMTDIAVNVEIVKWAYVEDLA